MLARAPAPCPSALPRLFDRGRFVYFETEYHPATVIELSEVAGPKGKLFKLIRDSASGWDGRDPVRPFPDRSKL